MSAPTISKQLMQEAEEQTHVTNLIRTLVQYTESCSTESSSSTAGIEIPFAKLEPVLSSLTDPKYLKHMKLNENLVEKAARSLFLIVIHAHQQQQIDLLVQVMGVLGVMISYLTNYSDLTQSNPCAELLIQAGMINHMISWLCQKQQQTNQVLFQQVLSLYMITQLVQSRSGLRQEIITTKPIFMETIFEIVMKPRTHQQSSSNSSSINAVSEDEIKLLNAALSCLSHFVEDSFFPLTLPLVQCLLAFLPSPSHDPRDKQYASYAINTCYVLQKLTKHSSVTRETLITHGGLEKMINLLPFKGYTEQALLCIGNFLRTDLSTNEILSSAQLKSFVKKSAGQKNYWIVVCDLLLALLSCNDDTKQTIEARVEYFVELDTFAKELMKIIRKCQSNLAPTQHAALRTVGCFFNCLTNPAANVTAERVAAFLLELRNNLSKEVSGSLRDVILPGVLPKSLFSLVSLHHAETKLEITALQCLARVYSSVGVSSGTNKTEAVNVGLEAIPFLMKMSSESSKDRAEIFEHCLQVFQAMIRYSATIRDLALEHGLLDLVLPLCYPAGIDEQMRTTMNRFSREANGDTTPTQIINAICHQSPPPSLAAIQQIVPMMKLTIIYWLRVQKNHLIAPQLENCTNLLKRCQGGRDISSSSSGSSSNNSGGDIDLFLHQPFLDPSFISILVKHPKFWTSEPAISTFLDALLMSNNSVSNESVMKSRVAIFQKVGVHVYLLDVLKENQSIPASNTFMAIASRMTIRDLIDLLDLDSTSLGLPLTQMLKDCVEPNRASHYMQIENGGVKLISPFDAEWLSSLLHLMHRLWTIFPQRPFYRHNPQQFVRWRGIELLVKCAEHTNATVVSLAEQLLYQHFTLDEIVRTNNSGGWIRTQVVQELDPYLISDLATICAEYLAP